MRYIRLHWAAYDTLPEVLQRDRWYASRVSLNLPSGTPARQERVRWLIDEIHKIPAANWDAVPA